MVQTIAQQCPYTGGDAVFRARALYSLVNQTLEYNDREICGLVNIEIRSGAQQLAKPQAKLYPNPTRDGATLEYEIPSETRGELRVYSTMGQQLLTTNLQGGKMSYSFSTSQLYPGVYYFVMYSNGEIIVKEKLIIIR